MLVYLAQYDKHLKEHLLAVFEWNETVTGTHTVLPQQQIDLNSNDTH